MLPSPCAEHRISACALQACLMAFNRAGLYDHEALLQRKKEAEQPCLPPAMPSPPPPPVEAVDPNQEETQVEEEARL